MKQNHEEMEELLPEYLEGLLEPSVVEQVRDHLQSCEDCRGIVALMTEMKSVPVPDPGELYWQTLPGRVVSLAKEEKPRRLSWFWSFFAQPFPIGTAALVLVLLALLAVRGKEPAVLDPLVAASYPTGVAEEHVVTDEDLSLALEKGVGEGVLGFATEVDDASYYREIASLTPEELKAFSEGLAKEQGGV